LHLRTDRHGDDLGALKGSAEVLNESNARARRLSLMLELECLQCCLAGLVTANQGADQGGDQRNYDKPKERY
jgi:hypothetical protein